MKKLILAVGSLFVVVLAILLGIVLPAFVFSVCWNLVAATFDGPRIGTLHGVAVIVILVIIANIFKARR